MHQIKILRPRHSGYHHIRRQVVKCINKSFRLVPKIFIGTAAPDQEIILIFGNDFPKKGKKGLIYSAWSLAQPWETYGGYEPFLTALTEFRRKHPDFEMQMVSYEDVILTIGTARYIEFCKQNNIKTCRISGDGVIELARMDMNAAGIDTLTFIDYNLPEKDVEFAVQTGRAVMLRNVRDGMEPRDGMISWDRRIRYLRKRGVNAPIYATAGITCGASLLEAKQAP